MFCLFIERRKKKPSWLKIFLTADVSKHFVQRETGHAGSTRGGTLARSLLFAFKTNCTVFSIHVCLATGHNMKHSLRIKFKGLYEINIKFLHLITVTETYLYRFGKGRKCFTTNKLKGCFQCQSG
uniref:Uncharacterized protein n=1 Tax=Micrurus spixii TaxID=129469 RepID=A0A2D4MI73_9SAUR